jgi:dipeptidyl aminopeptidase/acylaminoacyl peptidase
MLQRLAPLAFAILPLACLGLGVAQEPVQPAQEKRPLDHDAYVRWNSLNDARLTRDGKWALWIARPADEGDAKLHVRATQGENGHVVERAADPRFDPTGRWAVFQIKPPRDEVKALKKEGKKEDDLPKDALGILSLESGDVQRIERVKSFAVPEKDGERVAWLHLEPEKKKKGKGDDDGEEEGEEEEESETEVKEPAPTEPQPTEPQPGEPPPTEPQPTEPQPTEPQPTEPQPTEPQPVEPQPTQQQPTEPQPGEPVSAEPEPEEPASEVKQQGEEEEQEEAKLSPEGRKEKKRIEDLRKKRKDGTELVLRQLATGAETRFEKVADYEFCEGGQRLALTTTDKQGELDGVHVVDAATGAATQVLSGEGAYKSLAFDESGERLAFLAATGEDYLADPQVWTLYVWQAGDAQAKAIARDGSAGLADGWAVSANRAPQFSESGRRLWFGSAPRAEREPEELPEDERVTVDVWAWTDDLIQPMQLEQLEEERNRSYLCVAHLEQGARIVQLGALDMPEVTRPRDGESALVCGESDLPYRRRRSWESQVPSDLYAVDVETGERRRLLEGRRGNVSLSPSGTYAAWWDLDELSWRAIDLRSGREVGLTGALEERFDDELHDTPEQPRSYGSGGWLAGDQGFFVYDRYDVWLVDPSGRTAPRCATDGAGRREGVRLRVVDLDREEEAIDPEQPLLLSAFDYTTRDAGFWRDGLAAGNEPQPLVMGPHDYGTPVKADEADLLRFTRESFAEFGDLWVSGPDWADARRLSDVNPQQAEYAWGTSELVHWTSADGQPLEGLLFKPEGFDPARKYPLVAYFYERMSDSLHSHRMPTPGGSSIAFSFYTSRGYLVFVPDIPYKVGYPGRSAQHAIVSGVIALIDQGFVDSDAIGLQGHSWGGYQTAYLITQTDLFSAAVSGAPVANMTSAYGGIRWQTGMSRQFQYEKNQSRIGASLWEAPQRYVENSPLFYLDQVETPVLILHNDDDGAVPWYQGIEMFMGLRRLGKPAWLLNYNKQGHGLRPYALRRDYAVRMQQFFDHHLKGAPPAVWMVDGVPALSKGRDLGLQLVEEAPLASAGTR